MKLSEIKVTDLVTVAPFVLVDGPYRGKYRDGVLLPEEKEPGIVTAIGEIEKNRVTVEFGGPGPHSYRRITFWPSELLPAA